MYMAQPTHLQQHPDFLFHGSLCLWTLLCDVIVGHHPQLKKAGRTMRSRTRSLIQPAGSEAGQGGQAEKLSTTANDRQPFSLLLKAAIRSSVPKLASFLPKRHAKTLQTPPTAQLTLIEVCQHINWCLLAV